MKRVTLVAAGAIGVMAGAAAADTLWDNGPPDGSNGYSNATVNVLGFRRALLDDFTLDGTCVLQGFHWEHIWNSFPPRSGSGMELLFRSDAGGGPGNVVVTANITSYSEMGTGQTYFSRPGAESWVSFDEIQLPGGTYWFEATIVGPENNFWLVHERDVRLGSECWVNYDDSGGLHSGSAIFGHAADLNFVIESEVISSCPEDLDGSGAVDVGDILAILAAWGNKGGPEDLDGNGVVDIGDLLIVLTAWGPCEG